MVNTKNCSIIDIWHPSSVNHLSNPGPAGSNQRTTCEVYLKWQVNMLSICTTELVIASLANKLSCYHWRTVTEGYPGGVCGFISLPTQMNGSRWVSASGKLEKLEKLKLYKGSKLSGLAGKGNHSFAVLTLSLSLYKIIRHLIEIHSEDQNFK